MMNSFLTPRLVAVAALAAVLLGIIGLWSGEMRWSSLGLLAGEILAIYAAILWTTPTIPPLSTRPAERPGSEHSADSPPTPQAAGADEATPSTTSPAIDGL